MHAARMRIVDCLKGRLDGVVAAREEAAIVSLLFGAIRGLWCF